ETKSHKPSPPFFIRRRLQNIDIPPASYPLINLFRHGTIKEDVVSSFNRHIARWAENKDKIHTSTRKIETRRKVVHFNSPSMNVDLFRDGLDATSFGSNFHKYIVINEMSNRSNRKLSTS
ncbi:hypothetical protein Tco_0469848, partial [Tanacetum coccineum]